MTSLDIRRPRRAPLTSLILMVLRQPLWAIPFGLFFGTLYGARWPVYVAAFKVSLVFSLCIGSALWGVRVFAEPRLLGCGPGDRSLGLRVGLVYIGAAVVASYLAAALVHLFVVPGFLGSPRAFLLATLYTLLFVALFGGINFAIAFYRVAMRQAQDIERQRAELARAELRALRAQINPHFLFNTLNTIASLIASDPPGAEDVTTRLADVFRYALAASDREHQRLGDELAFLRDLLGIERARFGERLRLREEIEAGLEAVPVPSLLLQPLVENAVRHAVAARPEGGTLTLRARRDGDTVVLEVADDGPGFVPSSNGEGRGFGLRSVRERLRLAGPPHALEVDSAPGRGTRVRVVLPLEPATHPGGPA